MKFKDSKESTIRLLQMRNKYKKVDFSVSYVKETGEIIKITTWVPQYRGYATVNMSELRKENRTMFNRIQMDVDSDRQELKYVDNIK